LYVFYNIVLVWVVVPIIHQSQWSGFGVQKPQ
jgi:hypothetical protein